MSIDDELEVEDLEIRLLLQAVCDRYGYDYRNYAWASLKRRILKVVKEEGLPTVSRLQERLLRDREGMARFLLGMAVSTTSMFRDPEFYLTIRRQILPLFAKCPHLRLWHAGCASGEEVYSMAIILHEEGLLERTRLYATDISGAAIARAKAGIFAQAHMREFTANYQKAGGRAAFSDYYVAKHDRVLLRNSLGDHIVWAEHNLASDASFNEFHLILCRNTLIYFDQALSARVHRLLYDSLALGGVLGLGSHEHIRFSPYADCYEAADEKQRLYRKCR